LQDFDPVLETRAVKTLLDRKPSSFLKQLSLEWFGLATTREIWARVDSLRRNGRDIPGYQVLSTDPVLSEKARSLLSGPAALAAPFEENEYASVLTQLDAYRQGRVIAGMAKSIVEKFSANRGTADDLAAAKLEIENALSKLQNAALEEEVLCMGGTEEKAVEAYEFYEQHMNERVDVNCIPTGIRAIDKQQGGLFRGKLYTIGAPSGGGKSTMAKKIAENVVAKAGLTARYCSLEMSKEECLDRTASTLSRIPHDKFTLKTLTPMEREKSDRTMLRFLSQGAMRGARLDYHCPARNISVPEFLQEIEHENYSLLVLDYINLFRPINPKEGLWWNIGEAFRLVKLFAERKRCAVIMLVQVDEDTGSIKYAKSIKHHSDGVWTWDYNKEKAEAGIPVDVDQIKMRGFKPMKFALLPQFEYCDFTESSESIGGVAQPNPNTRQEAPQNISAMKFG